MKSKITELIGAEQAAKVEARAEKRGLDNIWDRAAARALADLGLVEKAKAGELSEVEAAATIKLAAVRAQQLTGCIPKFLPPEKKETAEATAETEPPKSGRKAAKAKAEPAAEPPAAPAPEPAPAE